MLGILFPVLLQLHAVRVSNDNGTFKADISSENLEQWVNFANNVFAPAGIIFSVNPVLSDLKSTLINSLDSDEVSYNWQDQKRAIDFEADKYPGEVSVFFIYGDSSSGPRGGGFSWLHYNFIVMPGFNEATLCGHQNIRLLAHELGHYFGLLHTFDYTFSSKDTLLSRISGYGAEYMDGDALSSTALDPALYKDESRPMECYDPSGINDTVSLNGILYNVPRDNIMSYYDYPFPVLTGQQIEIIHNTLLNHPLKKHLVKH